MNNTPGMNNKMNVARALENVQNCVKCYDDAEAASSAARSAAADALNRLNEAQKAFDELVVVLKKNAPKASDWRKP